MNCTKDRARLARLTSNLVLVGALCTGCKSGQNDYHDISEAFRAARSTRLRIEEEAPRTTPLHEAAKEGRVDAAESLLAAGADVDARDESGRTPLPLAAWEGNTGVVELLLAKGAAANSKDYLGGTPLHAAAKGGTEIVTLLLERV